MRACSAVSFADLSARSPPCVLEPLGRDPTDAKYIKMNVGSTLRGRLQSPVTSRVGELLAQVLEKALEESLGLLRRERGVIRKC